MNHRFNPLVTNLPVNSSNDGSPNPHAYDKTAMEVLVQKQRLNNSSQKEENSVEITLPVRLAHILSEVDHQSREEGKQRGYVSIA